MGISAKMTYGNNFDVVCSNCAEKLEVSFEKEIETGKDVTFYQCNCGYTRVTSEKYHNFKDLKSKRLKEKEVALVVKAMSDMVNSLSTEKVDMFVHGMAREHRTLQQSFTSVCLTWLQHLAKCDKSGNFDGRNEASVKVASEIMAKVENANYRLPMV